MASLVLHQEHLLGSSRIFECAVIVTMPSRSCLGL
ncbi:hypothetical protein Ahy_A02g009441 isoform F [Arachis hypogaea]|uniref:Uncharacterized protein n=1 Tax=Arachis hypogaea TaxID=3818 RepID=A0A445EGZ7_ARAHY|nr:hypothetical protein Ahy_A02g009441 isoform F [Arachis hypogaea]